MNGPFDENALNAIKEYFNADQLYTKRNIIMGHTEFRVLRNGVGIEFTITDSMAVEGFDLIYEMLKIQKRRLDIVAPPKI